jgi:hypothetical protein
MRLIVVAILAVACSPTAVASPVPSVGQSISPAPQIPALSTKPEEAVWTLVPLARKGLLGHPTAVEFVGDEIVATGLAFGPAHSTPEAWTSPDGVSWTQHPLGGVDSPPTSIAAWGNRLLAVGTRDGSDCPMGQAIAIWNRSADGIWREAPFNPLFCGAGDACAAASRDRAVIVGGDFDSQPFVWSSADGFRWTSHPGVFPSGAAPRPRVSNLPHGGLIASGSDLGLDEAWVSRSFDGIVWEQPRSLAVPPGGIVYAHVERVDGVTLLIGLADDRALVMTSPDGTNWQAAAIDGLSAVPELLSVRAYARGLIATGIGEFTAKVAVSTDGRHWRAVTSPAGAASDGVVGGGIIRGRAVLVGFVEPDGNRVPVAWVGPESLLAP